MKPQDLFNLLNQIELGADHQQDYLINRSDENGQAEMQQLADNISTAFLNPNWQLSLPLYFGLAIHKHKLQAIFELSAQGNPDHCLQPLIKQFNRHRKPKLNEKAKQCLMKILLLLGFNHQMQIDPWYFLTIDKDLGIEAVLGMLAKRRLLFESEQANFSRFLTQLATIKKWPLHDHSPVVLGQAWYQAAYDSEDQKYDILKTLNHLAKRWLTQKNIAPEAKSTIEPGKARMIVVLEHFRSNHAMYRCFANGLDALKAKYHLIAVGEPNAVDDTSRQLFDEFIPVQLKTPCDIAALSQRLSAMQADCVYFTSVGMKYWSVMLANMRLAPIQVLTAGHPISACTETIDIMLLEDHKFLKEIHFEETVVGMPSGTFGFVLPEYTLPEIASKSSDTVKIALPASVYKLNANFLSICQRIAATATVPLEFHSFSGCRGLEYHQLSHKIRQRLSNSFIYPAMSYDDYLKQLSQCDVYLAPFPFGGTNSTIDCLLLNIPSIALDYPDLACADPFILRQVGFDDCVAKTIDEYIALAVSLINDSDKRGQIGTRLAQLDEQMGGILGSKQSGQAYQQAIEYALMHPELSQNKTVGFISSESYR